MAIEITSKNYDGKLCRLHHKSGLDNRPAHKHDLLEEKIATADSPRTRLWLISGKAPHRSNSSGRVVVEEELYDSEKKKWVSHSTRELFPHVFKLEWVIIE